MYTVALYNLLWERRIIIWSFSPQPNSSKKLRRWTQEAEETLQGGYDAKDCDALCELHGDVIKHSQ